MPRFTKRPITIDAILAGEVLDGASSGRFSRLNAVLDNPMPGWIVDAFEHAVIGFERDAVLINTQGHGEVRAERADWIIRGVQGELYPCRPDVFEKTYEPGEGSQVITIKGNLPPEQFAAFKERWNREAAGVQNAWKTPIFNAQEEIAVESGWVELKDQPPPKKRDDLVPCWETVHEEFRQRYRVSDHLTDPSFGAVVRDVLDDMIARDATGRERYGVPLTAFNGRDQLVDAYQEALDLAVYLRAAQDEGITGASAVYSNTLHNIFWLRVAINARSKPEVM